MNVPESSREDGRSPRGEGVRAALVGLAALALGYAIGVRSARLPAPPAPAEGEVLAAPASEPQAAPLPVPDTVAAAPRTSVAAPSLPSSEMVSSTSTSTSGSAASIDTASLARIAVIDSELAVLANALATPAAYRTPSAVLDDLSAHDAARERRDALAAALSLEGRSLLRDPPPAPEALRARRRAIERAGALGLEVRGVPAGIAYLPVPAPSPEGRGAETSLFQGVSLGADAQGPRIVFRTRKGDVERKATISEDPSLGTVLRVEWAEQDGPVRLVRRSRLGPVGETWRAFAERLWTSGAIEHEELERLVARPLDRPPRPGWIDWLRRHLDLPRNRDLGEEYGPPPPLPRTNPLLLLDPRSRPAVLERGDLVVDPERDEPPVALVGRGPFILIAANAVGVYDASAWQWLVFDSATRRVVDHAELSSGEVRHLRWDFLPEPERFPQARRGDLTDALLSTALERTRQAIQLVTLPGEVTQVAQELRSKQGGVLTRDGLDALRLRNEVLDRHKRLNWLGHLLLDDDGANYYERALDRAKLETTAEVVNVILRMIEDGHDGPAEYLMRDDRVKQMLWHPPCEKTDRDRLRKAFREKFRPFGVRFRRAFSGPPSYWYEVEDGG